MFVKRSNVLEETPRTEESDAKHKGLGYQDRTQAEDKACNKKIMFVSAGYVQTSECEDEVSENQNSNIKDRDKHLMNKKNPIHVDGSSTDACQDAITIGKLDIS